MSALTDDRGHLQDAPPVLWPAILRVAFVACGLLIAWYIREQIVHQRTEVFEVPQKVVVVQPQRDDEPPPEEPDEQEMVDDSTEVHSIEPAAAPPPDMPMTADDSLGLDAEGVAGSDGFGLLAKRGARDLLLSGNRRGGDAQQSAYQRYAGALRQFIHSRLLGFDDLRRASYTADVAIWVDRDGAISRFEVRRSSGDVDVDRALETVFMALPPMPTPPPPTMPQPVRMRISTSGAGAL